MTPPGEVKKKKKKGYLARIARYLFVFICIVILFIIAAPTIITLLPIERKLETTVNESIPGTLRIEGLRVGWFSPPTIRRLAVSDDTREQIILEDVRLKDGLLRLLRNPEESVHVEVARFYYEFAIEEDGSFNYEKIVPPSDEPFTLEDLINMFPKVEIPVEKIYFHVADFDFLFEDRSTPSQKPVSIEDGFITANWTGGEAPFLYDVYMPLMHEGRTEPLRLEGEYQNWVKDKQTNFPQSTFLLKLLSGEDERAIGWKFDMKHPRVNNNVEIDLSFLEAFYRLFEIKQPRLEGKLTSNTDIDLSDLDSVQLNSSIDGEEFEILDLPSLDEPLPITDFRGDLSLEFSGSAPSYPSGEFSFDFEFLQLKGSVDSSTETPRRVGEVSIYIPFSDIRDYLHRYSFWPEGIDWKESRAELSLFFNEQAEENIRFNLVSTLYPGAIDLNEQRRADLPLQLSNGEITLQPFETRTEIDGEYNYDSKVKVDYNIENEIFHLSGQTDFSTSNSLSIITKEELNLTRLNQWIQETIPDLPLKSIEGGLVNTNNLWMANDEITWKTQGYSLDKFIDLDPFGYCAYEEDFSWESNIRVNPDERPIVSGSGSLRSSLLDIDTVFDILDDQNQDLFLALEVNTESIYQELEELGLLPELPLEQNGSFKVDLNLARNAMNLQLLGTLKTDEAYSTNWNDQVDLESLEGDILTDITYGSSDLTVYLHDLSLGIDEVLKTNLRGTFNNFATMQSFDLSNDYEIDFAELLKEAQAYVPQEFQDLIELDGTTKLTVQSQGSVASGESVLRFIDPVTLSGRIESEIPSLFIPLETGGIVFEGLSDSRSIDITADSLEDYSLKASGEMTLEYLEWEGGVALEQGSWEDHVDYQSAGNIVYRLIGAGFEGGEYFTETLNYVIPDFLLKGNFSADLSKSIYDLSSLDFKWGDYLSAGFKTSINKMEGILDSSLTIKGLGGELGAIESRNEDARESYNSSLEGTSELKVHGEFHPVTLLPDLNSSWFELNGEWPRWLLSADNNITSGSMTYAFSASGETQTGEGELQVMLGQVDQRVGISESLKGLEFVANGYTDFLSQKTSMGAEIENEETGSILNIEASIPRTNSAVVWFQGEGAEKPDLIRAFPITLSINLSQSLEKLNRIIDGRNMSGFLNSTLQIRNLPSEAIELSFEQKIETVNFDSEDLNIRGLNGDFVLGREWLSNSQRDGATPVSRMSVYLPEANLSSPGFSSEILNTSLVLNPTASGMRLSLLGEEVLGGAHDTSIAINLRNDVPFLSGEISMTKLDASSFYPGLKSLNENSRTLSTFGFFEVPFPDDAGLLDVSEQLYLGLEVTDIKVPALRAILRSIDPNGSNPGVQSTLTILRFSYPSRATLLIRNGLLSLHLRLISVTGEEYTIPLLEKVSVTSYLSQFSNPDVDESITELQQLLKVLLEDDLDNVYQLLN